MNTKALLSLTASLLPDQAEFETVHSERLHQPVFTVAGLDHLSDSVTLVTPPVGTLTQEPSAIEVHWFEASRQNDNRRPRRWTPEARAACEYLSNAMEYLADSREIHPGRFMSLDEQNPDAQAILILMGAKQQIALALPFIERRKSSVFGGWKGVERRKDRQN